MLTEHRTMIKTIFLTTTPDGSLGIVLGFPVAGFTVSFARADVSGAWMASFIDALGQGSISFGGPVAYDCRVRVDARAQLFELGHVCGDRWFDVRPVPAQATPALRPSRVAHALSFLNGKRARVGRQDLEPVATGYTDDDIVADALHYGWKG